MRASIEIDVDTVLDQLDDEDLLNEVAARKLNTTGMDPIEEITTAYEELLRGRYNEALAILDRLLNPKWPSEKRCKEDYLRAMHKAEGK